MNRRQQWLLHYAIQVGYLTKEQTRKISPGNLSIDSYLLEHCLLKEEQLRHLQFLYLKNCLLHYGQQAGYISREQGEMLLQQKIEAFSKKCGTMQLESVAQGFVPANFYSQCVGKLLLQKIVTMAECRLFSEIISTPGTGHTKEIATMAADTQNNLADATIAAENVSADATMDAGADVTTTQSHMTPSFMEKVPKTAPAKGTDSSFTDIEIGTMFRHYRIDSELGRGGMGVVYKAYDTKLDRLVALKLILSSANVTPVQIERFVREARSVAKLDHPNVIRVYEVGDEDPKYFTMEYIAGEDFSTRLREGKIKFTVAAKIMQKVAEALHSAHRKGIIHRDIKSSNIMLDSKDEPRLMDFGLVKVSDENRLSLTGDMLGTPAYMPPEQVNGQEADARSDVYSLGATLYEALTGRTPFQGEAAMNIFCQIVDKEPIQPSALNPDVPQELEAICLKCLEKKPERRYKNAELLAKDLGNFLNQRPITAVSPTKFTYFKKWVLRNKTISIVSFISIVTILLAAVFLYRSWREEKRQRKTAEMHKAEIESKQKSLLESLDSIRKALGVAVSEKERAERERERAERERERAERAQENEKRTRYYANVVAASKYIDYERNVAIAEKWLQGAPKAYQHWEWFYLKSRLTDELFALGDNYYLTCAISPDGKYIAAGGHCKLELWNLQTQKQVWSWALDSHHAVVKTCAFSPDGRRIVCGTLKASDNLYVVDTRTRRIVRLLRGHTGSIKDCDVSPDGKFIASGGTDCTLKIWHAATGELYAEQLVPPDISGKPRKQYIRQCKFTPDSKRVVFCNFEIITVYDIRTKKMLVHGYDKEEVFCLAHHPRYPIIASGCRDGGVRLWQAQARRKGFTLRRIFEVHAKPQLLFTTARKKQYFPQKAKISPPLRKLFADAGHPLTLNPKVSTVNNRTWNIEELRKNYLLEASAKTSEIKGYFLPPAHQLRVFECCFSPDGTILATVSEDSTIKLWELQFADERLQGIRPWGLLKGHRSKALSCVFHPSGKNIVSVAKKIKVWPVKPPKPYIEIPGNGQGITSCTFSPDGSKIAITTKTAVKLWNWQQDTAPQIIDRPFPLNTCSFDPSGTMLASSEHFSRKLKIWSVKDQSLISSWKPHQRRRLIGCEFNPQGKTILTATKLEIKIWNFDEQECINQFSIKQIAQSPLFKPNHGEILKYFEYCTFSPNGRKVLATVDRFIVLFDVATATVSHIFFDDKATSVNFCSFSPDSSRIISAHSYNVRIGGLLLWSIKDGYLRDFQGHHVGSRILGCAFNNKGDRIVSVADDRSLRMWSPKRDQEILRLCLYSSSLNCCAFSPNGKTIIAGAEDGTLMLWKVDFHQGKK